MAKRSKRYRRASETLKEDTVYTIAEAVDLLKTFDGPKFDESVEIAIRLGIDPKQANQIVRGAFSLPNGIGKEVRVVVFAEGAALEEAKEAGAIETGGEDLVKKIQEGWLDFDVAIAHPSLMRHVGKLGRVLGPHGKMPTPKSGTVTDKIKETVTEFVAGKIEFRNDDSGNLHAVMGKKSFSKEKLVENIEAFLGHIRSLKPATSKGVFFQGAAVATTMGPGVPLKIS